MYFASGGVAEGGDAQRDSASLVGDLIELLEFVSGAVEADLETFDFTEPSLVAGFGDAADEVVTYLDEPIAFGRIGPHQGAAQAGVFVDAWGGVGGAAGPESELAVLEVA